VNKAVSAAGETLATGVLEGLEVLDLSWGIAGPLATMILADNGARVTRIERAGGDPFAEASGYAVWQRGKRHMVLDLHGPEDKAAFFSLAAGADVVVESFSPGTADRLGLGYARLSGANPRLIWCSITGYGPHGRLRGRPGYDALVAARTGLLYDQAGRPGAAMELICGRAGPFPEYGAPEGLVRGAGRPGPIFTRSPLPSLGAALLAALGISAALRVRGLTGHGQRVETSLLQGALCAATLSWQRVENPDAPGYWMWTADGRAPDGLFACADGRWVHHWPMRPSWVFGVAAGEALAAPDVANAPAPDLDRLGTEPSDFLAAYFLYEQLAAAFARLPAADWVQAAERSGVGMALVRSPAEALADPSLLEDGSVVQTVHPAHGRIHHVGNVIEFDDTAARLAGPVARRGEHIALLAQATSPSGPSPAPVAPTTQRGALAGIRVIDLGLGIAGPFAGRTLADLGADVIKVHAPHDAFWAGTHMGLATNRGKRSIAVDLKDRRGLEILHRLIYTADVVICNWRAGVAARLGLDYDSLRARHARLVYCEIRGYEKGGRSGLAGTDQTASALSGTEWEDGACDAGNPPLWGRTMIGDIGAGLLGAIGAVMALYRRDATGRGQLVGTSILRACLLNASYAWICADGRPGDWTHVDSGQFGLSARYRLYQATDGWVFVAAVSEDHVGRLARSFDRPGLMRSSEDELAACVAQEVSRRTTAEVFALLDTAGVPVEIVDDGFCRKMFDDPEMRRSGLIARTWAGAVGAFEDPGVLLGLSETPPAVDRGPCLCGQHTREILFECGYSDADVDRLAYAGVVLDAPLVA